MSSSRKVLDKKCAHCNHPLVESSMKNPFIDDHRIECENEDCSQYFDGMRALRIQAGQVAKQENE